MPIFEQAARDYHCPVELLLTLGQMGSRFEDRGSTPTIEQGYGLMALRQNRWGADSLVLASILTDVEIARLKVDPISNIRGAAAVLDKYAQQEHIDRTQGLEAWVPVVVRYAGLDAENSRLFAMELYQKLERGFTVTTSQGETIKVEPVKLAIVPEYLRPSGVAMTLVDYFLAIWDPAATCNYVATSSEKDTVVIHTAEGTAAGVRAWFKNCAAQESIHYVVSEVGTVWQMVREHHEARHATCYNNRAVGIIHEGYASSPSHPQSLYNASAALCRDICNRWSIPKRHATAEGPGIMGHIDVNLCCCGRSDLDPGPGWDWDYYLNQVFGAPPPSIVAAVSRKQYGLAGFSDVDVSVASAVEPRHGGPTTLVVTFDRVVESVGEPDVSDVTLSSGLVYGIWIDNCELTVEINGATDATTFTVAFPGIVDQSGIGVTDTLCFAVLEGDMNGNRRCNLFDVLSLRDAMDKQFKNDNFIYDINADGLIDFLDMGRIRGNMDQAIPQPCP